MNKSVAEVLKTLADESNQSEAQIVSQALESGLKQLWRDRVLAQYLKKLITRQEAIEQVGLDFVELAERQSQAVMEDIQWAMND